MGHLTNVANSIVQSAEKGKNKAALDTIFAGESSMHPHISSGIHIIALC